MFSCPKGQSQAYIGRAQGETIRVYLLLWPKALKLPGVGNRTQNQEVKGYGLEAFREPWKFSGKRKKLVVGTIIERPEVMFLFPPA